MLSILGTPRYGQDIVDVVSKASNGHYQLDPGTLYPALHRLKRRGLIQEKKIEDKQVYEELIIRRGHNRRYYKVSPEGKNILSEIDRIRLQIRAHPCSS